MPKAIKAGVAFFISIVLFVGIVTTRVIRQKRVARSFLSEAAALKLESADDAQVRRLASRYGGRIGAGVCNANRCSYFFSFDNSWLRRLHLAPPTRLTSTLSTENGILVHRNIELASGKPLAAYIAFVDERLSLRNPIEERLSLPGLKEPFDIGRETSGGSRWRVFVNLTPAATNEQHRIAYDLDVGCLSRIGGCEDAYQLLPSVNWGA